MKDEKNYQLKEPYSMLHTESCLYLRKVILLIWNFNNNEKKKKKKKKNIAVSDVVHEM